MPARRFTKMLDKIKFNSTFRMMTGSEHERQSCNGSCMSKEIFHATIQQWLKYYYNDEMKFNNYIEMLIYYAYKMSKQREDSITIELLDPATQKYIKQLTIFYNKIN
jgi:hypothetical protein